MAKMTHSLVVIFSRVQASSSFVAYCAGAAIRYVSIPRLADIEDGHGRPIYPMLPLGMWGKNMRPSAVDKIMLGMEMMVAASYVTKLMAISKL